MQHGLGVGEVLRHVHVRVAVYEQPVVSVLGGVLPRRPQQLRGGRVRGWTARVGTAGGTQTHPLETGHLAGEAETRRYRCYDT